MIKSLNLNKILFTLLCVIIASFANGQISKPSLSPRIKTEQKVGMVNVTLDYGQPNKQNRKIFGGLIPYNKLWRTGANASTKITFDRQVKLDALLLGKAPKILLGDVLWHAANGGHDVPN